ncbi:MAG: type II toxin-antitoxin system YafQ family toxin [Alphaproteobacteria bacterium]|nr:type II toxin-antitoxin system YafQ family toxin [Alphaproteobacteria bacterium]MBV9373727.1 type II toxin-antitoxin system YafQ family toxin [Alphaproteobacteria bacterium]
MFAERPARFINILGASHIIRFNSDVPPRNRDHALSGNWSGYRDCHLWPDMLRRVRLGSHSDLFD